MITPIQNFNTTNNYFRKENFSGNVSFGSKPFLKLAQIDITRKVRAAIQDESNIIGWGGQGTVYRIPKSEYCIKILRDDLYNFGKWNMNIRPSDKVNHVVAKAANGTPMMKIIQGDALLLDKINDEVYELPIDSFRRLLQQISDADSLGMRFDSAPQNIIYNPETKSLTAIDFVESNIYKELEYQPVFQVFEALWNSDKSTHGKEQNRKLFANLLETILDEIKPGNNPSFEILEADITQMFNKMIQSDDRIEYKYIKNIVFEILNLRERGARGEKSEQEISNRIKLAKHFIDKTIKE